MKVDDGELDETQVGTENQEETSNTLEIEDQIKVTESPDGCNIETPPSADQSKVISCLFFLEDNCSISSYLGSHEN